MAKYIKKPVAIEAVEWTGENFADISKFCKGDAYIEMDTGLIDSRGEVEKLKQALKVYGIEAQNKEIIRFKSSYYNRLVNEVIKRETIKQAQGQ